MKKMWCEKRHESIRCTMKKLNICWVDFSYFHQIICFHVRILMLFRNVPECREVVEKMWVLFNNCHCTRVLYELPILTNNHNGLKYWYLTRLGDSVLNSDLSVRSVWHAIIQFGYVWILIKFLLIHVTHFNHDNNKIIMQSIMENEIALKWLSRVHRIR